MGEQASIESFEALAHLRTALTKFMDSAAAVLYTAEAHLMRTKTWVKTEQAQYWKTESQKRAETLIHAKLALKAKKLMPSALGGKQTCVDEEAAVKKAQHRVAEAEQKSAAVKYWGRQIDVEALAYQTWATGLKQAVSIDIPAAIARIDQMLLALEAYVAHAPRSQASVAASGGAGELAAAGELESVTRAVQPESDADEKSADGVSRGEADAAAGDGGVP